MKPKENSLGIVTLVRLVHSTKASFPMLARASLISS